MNGGRKKSRVQELMGGSIFIAGFNNIIIISEAAQRALFGRD
jgi:hypothetical protein